MNGSGTNELLKRSRSVVRGTQRRIPDLLGDMPYNGISPIEFVRILFSLLLLLLLLLFLSVWILGPWYIKNRINNHIEIFTVSLSLSEIENLLFSVWSLNHVRFILWKHITLICQHDKLPLVIIIIIIISFCMNFGTVIYQEQNQQSYWNFYSIFVIIRNRKPPLFSLITQPWRHPGAILCFDVIIDIFISVYHKLTKFNTHKLQVIRQHTDNPCPRARHDAHVRASQNFNMLKITYKQFWVQTRSFRAFQNFPSVRVRARVMRAHSARKGQNSKFLHDLDSSYHNWKFPFISVTLDLS